jgi:hypothetical protein
MFGAIETAKATIMQSIITFCTLQAIPREAAPGLLLLQHKTLP